MKEFKRFLSWLLPRFFLAYLGMVIPFVPLFDNIHYGLTLLIIGCLILFILVCVWLVRIALNRSASFDKNENQDRINEAETIEPKQSRQVHLMPQGVRSLDLWLEKNPELAAESLHDWIKDFRVEENKKAAIFLDSIGEKAKKILLCLDNETFEKYETISMQHPPTQEEQEAVLREFYDTYVQGKQV